MSKSTNDKLPQSRLRITLNNEDRDAFLKDLDSDEPLSDALLKAVADFKARYGSATPSAPINLANPD